MEAVEVYQMYCALKAHFAKGDMILLNTMVNHQQPRVLSGNVMTGTSLYEHHANIKTRIQSKITYCQTSLKIKKGG